MAQLIINRSAEYIHKFRDIVILVDNQPAGEIADGETKIFEIPGGAHTVSAKINWCGSAVCEFTVSNDEQVTFNLSGFKGKKLFFIVAGIAILATFLMEAYLRSAVLLTLVSGAVLFMVYILTLGRNKYLSLGREIDLH